MTGDGGPDGGPGEAIRRPPDYSDEEWEAFKAGAAAGVEFVARTTSRMAASMAAEAPPPNRDEGGEDDEDEKWPESCGECGADLVYEMGSAEGECPNCDLIPEAATGGER